MGVSDRDEVKGQMSGTAQFVWLGSLKWEKESQTLESTHVKRKL